MKEGPDISRIAALLGDPARSNMVMALMSGMSLTAAELTREAGITPSTASLHLSKLKNAGIVTGTSQGRHRYFRIAAPDVAAAVEALSAVAARAGHLRTRPGPKDEAMRNARSCYDHLAGHRAVDLFEHWMTIDVLTRRENVVELTSKGRLFLMDRGIDIEALEREKRPLCRACLDWSERRNHLGGSIGAAAFSLILDKTWAFRDKNSRTIRFTADGDSNFTNWYSSFQ